MAIAIETSKLDESLGVSAGARFITILPLGNWYPDWTIADLILSLDSSTAFVAMPTILTEGKPLVMLHSTVTQEPSRPLLI
jgi:hypothetical protein